MLSTEPKPVQESNLDHGIEVSYKEHIQSNNDIPIALHEATRECILFLSYLIIYVI